MSNYERVLPQVFPYVTEVTKEQARYLVLELTSQNRTDVPFGSSFAIVSGYSSKQLQLWMSSSSFDFLNSRFAQIQANVPGFKDWSMPTRRNYGYVGE